MTYSIRRLGPEDLGAYRALRLEALEAAPEAFGTAHEEAARQSDAYFRSLLERLAARGHMIWPLNLHPGDSPLDAHIDTPPYALPHIKLEALGCVSTSIGIVVQRGG